jgi:hypothetical protein
MFNLLHIVLYVLGTLYTALGAFVLRQALRPSCRVCINRQECPRRLRGAARFTMLPFCARTADADASPKPTIPNQQSINLAQSNAENFAVTTVK